MNKKPNIVFFLTDDQRYNTINALGNKEVITPNMDKLVKMGTSFTNAHIPSGTSGAVCMPSRAMLNSGRTLFHLENGGGSIPAEHTTIGECLQANGYFTFGTGKWHNGPPAFARSFSGGENIFFGGMWDHWNVPVNRYDPTGEYDNVINFVCNYFGNNKPTKVHCDAFNPGVHSSELLSKTCTDFLESYNEDKPYYMYCAYLAPHDPRTMPERFLDMYNEDDITLPSNYLPEHHFEFGIGDIRDEVLVDYPRTKDAVKKELKEYYAMITHLDEEIGKVIDAVEARGEMDNTIFILAGDNGLGMGCHGLFGKQNHYDHSVRVPLVIAGPSIPVNEIRDQYVYLLDIFPSICDIVGAEIPSSVEGKSFKKIIDDKTEVTRENLFFAYCELLRSVKDDRYKLIEYRNVANETQLFDLQNDPDEITNIYGKEGTEEISEKLHKLMFEYRESWDDNLPAYGEKFWNAF